MLLETDGFNTAPVRRKILWDKLSEVTLTRRICSAQQQRQANEMRGTRPNLRRLEGQREKRGERYSLGEHQLDNRTV